MPVHPPTLAQASDLVHRRELSSMELVEAVLARVEAYNPTVNCYGLVNADAAREQAAAHDKLLASGVWLGALHGIPVGVKDCIDTAGVATTFGSRAAADRVPDRDATVVERLYGQGAILLGKTNLYECAFGAPSPLWGDVRNPWDLTRTCGFSSSGSAAAVAAQLAPGALGTDSGGSVRIPAALCGVYGLKPTFGRVSRHGVSPVGSTNDQVGPLTRDVASAAMLLEAIAGRDDRDPSTWHRPAVDSYREQLGSSVRGMRVGVLAREPGDLSEDMAEALERAEAVLRDLGCSLVAVELPSLNDSRVANWVIAGVESALANRPYLESSPQLFDPTVKALLTLAEFIPATHYVHVQRLRELFIRQVSDRFREVDAIVMPTVPCAAWTAGEHLSMEFEGEIEDELGIAIRYNTLWNLTGNPAASVPAGFNADGLPLAVQIVSDAFEEATVLRLSHAFESATGFAQRAPADASLVAAS